jgi:hypothetical protein
VRVVWRTEPCPWHSEAGVVVGTGAAAGAVAGLAPGRGRNRQFLGPPEHRGAQVDLQVDQGVLTALRARDRATAGSCSPTEEGLEDIAEAPEAGAAETTGRLAVLATAVIVVAALDRIGEHLIGHGDLFELLFVSGVDVRVELARQLPVGLLDLLGRRVARHAQGLIVIAHVFPSS